MISIFSLLLFIGTALLVGLGVIGGGGYALFQVISNFQPSRRRLNSDAGALHQLLDKFRPQLITWTDEDWALLSHVHQEIKQTNFIISKGSGVVVSIYQQPMIAFAYKKYLAAGTDILLLASTQTHEFVYRIQHHQMEVWHKEKFLGTLKKDLVFYNPQKQPIARIDKTANLQTAILLGSNPVLAITAPEAATGFIPRAIDFCYPQSGDNETLLLALMSFELIKTSLPK